MTLGELITKHRKDNYWTSTKLCCMVGVSTTQMSAIEKGRKRPSFEVYIKLTKLFGLSLKDRAILDNAFLISKYGDNYLIIRDMWETIFFNEKGMI